MTVLHIDSSARFNRSHTRRLSELFISELRQQDPDIKIIRRDLSVSPPPPVTEAWIAAAFSKDNVRTSAMNQALRISDELVNELLSSDLYVFGVPMYNYGVPAVFKSYIDQIVRVGRTFAFDPSDHVQPYTGLVRNKRAVVITSRGEAGYGPDGPYWLKNHVERYIMDVFGFLGVEQIHTVAVENDEFGGASLDRSVRSAEKELVALAADVGVGTVCCA